MMVPGEGVEPSHPLGRQILSLHETLIIKVGIHFCIQIVYKLRGIVLYSYRFGLTRGNKKVALQSLSK